MSIFSWMQHSSKYSYWTLWNLNLNSLFLLILYILFYSIYYIISLKCYYTAGLINACSMYSSVNFLCVPVYGDVSTNTHPHAHRYATFPIFHVTCCKIKFTSCIWVTLGNVHKNGPWQCPCHVTLTHESCLFLVGLLPSPQFMHLYCLCIEIS